MEEMKLVKQIVFTRLSETHGADREVNVIRFKGLKTKIIIYNLSDAVGSVYIIFRFRIISQK